jgi:hypothetical protein
VPCGSFSRDTRFAKSVSAAIKGTIREGEGWQRAFVGSWEQRTRVGGESTGKRAWAETGHGRVVVISSAGDGQWVDSGRWACCSVLQLGLAIFGRPSSSPAATRIQTLRGENSGPNKAEIVRWERLAIDVKPLQEHCIPRTPGAVPAAAEAIVRGHHETESGRRIPRPAIRRQASTGIDPGLISLPRLTTGDLRHTLGFFASPVELRETTSPFSDQ